MSRRRSTTSTRPSPSRLPRACLPRRGRGASCRIGNLVDNVNGSAFCMSQSRLINWGVGVFRQRGLFYEGDFNTLFEETSYGAFAQVRYPFTRFRRLVGEYRLERSDRFDLLSTDVEEPRRVGLLASNY